MQPHLGMVGGLEVGSIGLLLLKQLDALPCGLLEPVTGDRQAAWVSGLALHIAGRKLITFPWRAGQ